MLLIVVCTCDALHTTQYDYKLYQPHGDDFFNHDDHDHDGNDNDTRRTGHSSMSQNATPSQTYTNISYRLRPQTTKDRVQGVPGRGSTSLNQRCNARAPLLLPLLPLPLLLSRVCGFSKHGVCRFVDYLVFMEA